MKIKELIHIDKALVEKKKELERLRKEVEELQIMMDINYQEDTIDISDVYVIIMHDITYFAKKKEIKKTRTWFDFYDIFTNRLVMYMDKYDFLFHDFKESELDGIRVFPIREVYKEVNIYPNEKVPRLLIQKLYYKANGIKIKTLKKTLTMRNEE